MEYHDRYGNDTVEIKMPPMMKSKFERNYNKSFGDAVGCNI